MELYSFGELQTPKMESYSFGELMSAQPKRIQKKFLYLLFFFSFGYVIKISKSGGDMNFRYNYIGVHFFYLLFWSLVCNLKTI
jgi:hypothetical protein